MLVEPEKAEVRPVQRDPDLLVGVEELVLNRPERERQRRQRDCGARFDRTRPPPRAEPEYENRRGGDEVEEPIAADRAGGIDRVDRQSQHVRDRPGERVRASLPDHDGVVRLRESPAQSAGLGQVDQVPVRAQRGARGADEDQRGPATAGIQERAEEREQRQTEKCGDLRSDREAESEGDQRERHARPGEQEVGAAGQACREDEVVQRGRGLQDDDRKRREEQRCE